MGRAVSAIPRRVSRVFSRGLALVVDDVLHPALAREVDRERAHERCLQGWRCHYALLHRNWEVAEEVVHADAVALVRLHSVQHAVADVAVVPVGLRHIVRELGLVEVGLAVVASPRHQVLEGVLYSEAVHRHVTALDKKACLTGVLAVVDFPRDAVVGTPEPEVVTDNVAGPDGDHDPRLHLALRRVVVATDTREDVVEEARVVIAAWVRAVPPLQQRLSLPGASLQQHPCDADAVDVAHAHRGGALRRLQRCEAEAEEHLAFRAQFQRLLQVVNARRQHHVQARLQLRVDGCSRVRVPGHVDLLEAHRAAGREVGPHAVALHLWDVELELAAAVDADEGLLRNHGRGVHIDNCLAVVGLAAVARGRALRADEDHVPDGFRPTAHSRVAREPLLLAGGRHLSCDLGIAQEAAAGIAAADAMDVLRKAQVAPQNDAAEGCCLRDSPEHVAAIAEVFCAAPKGAQRPVLVVLVALLAIHAHVRVKGNVLGALAQAEDLRVVPHGHIDMVRAWLEEEGEPLVGELAVIHRRVAAIHCKGLADGVRDLIVLPRPEDLHAVWPIGWVRLQVASLRTAHEGRHEAEHRCTQGHHRRPGRTPLLALCLG
mmetsp:Transcript_41589/g.125943  ORF Transcript_41589/g.125943 Transcript_41589/m.125943 type:complete len:602 (+) Transcript_41589:350-2155(+)